MAVRHDFCSCGFQFAGLSFRADAASGRCRCAHHKRPWRSSDGCLVGIPGKLDRQIKIKEASFAQKSALSLKLLQKLRNLSRNGANFAPWGHVAAVRLQHQRLRMDELCESK